MTICKYYLDKKCTANDCGRCDQSPAYNAGRLFGISVAISNVKFFDYEGVTLETMNKISEKLVERLESIK